MFKKATEDFREASERRHDTPSQTNRFNKNLSYRSPVQKRLSIYNSNPGPRRDCRQVARHHFAEGIRVCRS